MTRGDRRAALLLPHSLLESAAHALFQQQIPLSLTFEANRHDLMGKRIDDQPGCKSAVIMGTTWRSCGGHRAAAQQRRF